MKLGVSSYSLYRAIQSKQMTILDAIQWMADQGAQHVEIVPIGFDLVENPGLIETIRRKTEEVGMDISNYAVGANFLKPTKEETEQEINRMLTHVDIAHRLGVKTMRHDVALRPIGETSVKQFEADLPTLIEPCRRIADYASQFGITTSLENHGYYIQSPERVLRVMHEVDRSNFKVTMDVGNVMCVDADSVSSVQNLLPYASMVHLKDFYYRSSRLNPGEGWFSTSHGNFLRGAIVGCGDIDMFEVIRLIRLSGYDGYISIEFEGMEDVLMGTRIGLDNARRMWEQAGQ
ncbi:sugar phosphate isomerase/epimerase [Paenibacillus sp. N3.4]|uniref:sugar phosphate isomerase/epimerase family protein n=1 Tax=Paenibacillus sp. N3.4 TaxID=2603222 RepID=UPI0011CA9546|nr:sugar phosphate isomerase/epimerase family protein [Paenibacillus sp. N3.4]TXK85182.1 sugar phosphate isomerase/epimerase [Paenibacillus sp. N3.4]